ncbi:MAG: hypothetical protein J5I47_08480 [Vicingus serpentipes]|nr:hypothetical protein [Vicingus serpentipes]
MFTFFVGMGLFTFAQPYNNSWINYSQQYYKFQISETGVYRIDSATLSNAGIPLSTIDPQNFQLFARGVEIPIRVEGEGDGVFDGSDFIEFYGEKNDGWFESQFYGGVANQPNPYYSLINDTIYYYLTWNSSIANQRLTIENDTNFSLYTPIDYFYKEELQYFFSNYYDGKINSVGGVNFGYDPTEGWFDNYFDVSSPWFPTFKTKSLNTKNAYLLAGNATLSATVLGESNYAILTSGDHHLQVNVASNVLDTIFEGYKKIDIQLDIPILDIGTNTTDVTFQIVNDLGTGADRQTIAHLKINYPHTTDLENKTAFSQMFLNDHPSEAKSYLSFTNFNASGSVLFYELTSGRRIQVIDAGSNYNCLIPNTGATKECFITSEGQVKNVNTIVPVNGTGTFMDYSAAFLDTAFIIVTHPSLMVEANAYAAYRLNPVAGNNPQNAIVFNINELYDQFAYGIEKHPHAIRGFMDYIVDTWPTSPKYLFLLGKSIKANESRKDVSNFANNLVPSYGIPASDNMLTAGLNGTINEPIVPTGRIAALHGAEVDWYLNKIIQHENPSFSTGTGINDWMKQVLHFAGGTDAQQSQQFVNSLKQLENIVEDTLFGGNVHSFQKNSSAPIQSVLSDSIKQYIADGVALMTFLGHASATGGFDQNIDDPSIWPNQNGKYPVIMGLACFAGDIHLSSANSTSEEHVLLNDKGVIGFLASVDLGIEAYLVTYAKRFYENLAALNYKGSIGEHMRKTIISIQGGGSNEYINSTALSMTFHGDPSLAFNTFDKPDFMIESPTVTFSPPVITSDIDSFDVNILVTNFGYAVNDSIIMELNRGFPDNLFPDTTYIKEFKATNYQEVISFTLPVDVIRGLGLNTFSITVDAINQVDELWENNNTVLKTLSIQSGEIIPIYPYEFEIVPNQGITLTASTAFPFEPSKNYVFEIDTTDYFNSPSKEATTVSSSGGIVTWTPNLLQSIPDSTVFFWRVSKDSVDATGFRWRQRSFQYINGKEGWQQDHFFQFENDEFQFIQHNRPTRKFNFVPNVKQLKGITYGAAGWSELNKIAYYIDADRQGKNGWGTTSSLHVAVLDSLTLKPWSANDYPNMGHANNLPIYNNAATEHFFMFRKNSPAQMTALENMLNDSIPNGNHILIWTWYFQTFPGYVPMPVGLRTSLSNLGAVSLPTVADSVPFLFYAKKGISSSAIEVIGDSIQHKNLLLSTTISTNANYANIYSEILGPAKGWDSLSWRVNPLEYPTTKDSTVLNVYGVDESGNETLLINNLPTDSGDIRITGRVDAAIYPYLKLNAFLSDDSLFTAPQLDRWQITYEGIPEAALDPKIYFYLSNDTVQEGETITLSIAVKNISRYDMDSLLIAFSVLTQNQGLQSLFYPRQKPLLADSVLIATIQFSTAGMGGLNSLLVEVNPNKDQLEKYHFNNLAEISFYVHEDKINPILDVTFDGRHILDGDIVSPVSEIVIELTDENLFLALNDTADYTVYITHPNGQEKRIYFYSSTGAETMQFIPASLPKNSSRIIYKANFIEDGRYKLRVQASDRSKNMSGTYDYLIGFEVINKSTITNIINYPNPFSTSTRFVFTLTGRTVPDIFKIQIMTITGRVVREINKDEIGMIHIGKNISEFAWDGTDTYGDRLANGLYLYRVITKIDNDDIELRSTSMDSYFKKGFGKMYLFR